MAAHGRRPAANAAFCPRPTCFSAPGCSRWRAPSATAVEVGLGTDVGAGTSLSLLETIDEAYKVQQLQGVSLSPLKSFYLATLGGVRALDLEEHLGNFLPGKEADFLVSISPRRHCSRRASRAAPRSSKSSSCCPPWATTAACARPGSWASDAMPATALSL
jgi:cytosine/adenosine deaminase-related metal-dependent hydrolase